MARFLNYPRCPLEADTDAERSDRPKPHAFPREPTVVAPSIAAQKVVIVNGTPEILELLETVLEAGHYDVVFVESNAHAYSQIKRVQPTSSSCVCESTIWTVSRCCRC